LTFAVAITHPSVKAAKAGSLSKDCPDAKELPLLYRIQPENRRSVLKPLAYPLRSSSDQEKNSPIEDAIHETRFMTIKIL
jgi:hypothetical protein